MTGIFFPTHYAELRRAAHEMTEIEDLKALMLHIADQIEASERGQVCMFCNLASAAQRLRSGLPCGPCILLD